MAKIIYIPKTVKTKINILHSCAKELIELEKNYATLIRGTIALCSCGKTYNFFYSVTNNCYKGTMIGIFARWQS